MLLPTKTGPNVSTIQYIENAVIILRFSLIFQTRFKMVVAWSVFLKILTLRSEDPVNLTYLVFANTSAVFNSCPPIQMMCTLAVEWLSVLWNQFNCSTPKTVALDASL